MLFVYIFVLIADIEVYEYPSVVCAAELLEHFKVEHSLTDIKRMDEEFAKSGIYTFEVRRPGRVRSGIMYKIMTQILTRSQLNCNGLC